MALGIPRKKATRKQLAGSRGRGLGGWACKSNMAGKAECKRDGDGEQPVRRAGNGAPKRSGAGSQEAVQETSTRCWITLQVLKGSIQAVRRQLGRAGSP